MKMQLDIMAIMHEYMWAKMLKIKVAVSVDKQRTLIRIYMEKYISV